ncbi:MAG: phosphoribosylamine--glycine ligase [Candidatus Latescibacterota bacterium]|nr:phosphoribosylamine--glycine ligase [Candidatus Latescibacterota bacterium]
MKILVIGKGGREHALIWKLAQSPRVKKLYAAPGNPGMETLAQILPYRVDTAISQESLLKEEIRRLGEWAVAENIDLTVVGPDDALAGGVVDHFKSLGLQIFGPTKAAARLESSKAFAKNLMFRIGVPTAAYKTFNEIDTALEYIRSVEAPLVVKASGLAAGKGAVVCKNLKTAEETVHQMLSGTAFGDAGSEVVIEEFMQGEEVSLFAICDGNDFVTLPPAQDHKAIFDGDKGPNTGGMGAYAPAPALSTRLQQDAENQIIRPILNEMHKLNCPFSGVLYCGLMLTDSGPKVVEFNVRFGDPECQILLPLLKSDLVDLLEACCAGRLRDFDLQVSKEASVCVVIASGGYPGDFEKGLTISGLTESEQGDKIVVFHAGTERQNGTLVTAGGRVLGVTSTDIDLPTAVKNVYAAANKISFENAYYRKDIAHRAL